MNLYLIGLSLNVICLVASAVAIIYARRAKRSAERAIDQAVWLSGNHGFIGIRNHLDIMAEVGRKIAGDPQKYCNHEWISADTTVVTVGAAPQRAVCRKCGAGPNPRNQR